MCASMWLCVKINMSGSTDQGDWNENTACSKN